MVEAAAAAGETVGEALRAGAAALSAAGCDTPRLDAELLLAEILGGGRERLVMDRGKVLAPALLERYRALVDRRADREPLAYIVGRREFRRLTLSVDRRVLIPRPETELLVEAGLELGVGARVADVGTGSGAVALALADERADLEVTGLDIDPNALEVARANARRLGLAVRFLEADLLAGGEYDAVLANLPYVAEGHRLPPDVAGFEPPGALFAGVDGLDLVRRLVAQASGVRMLALEISPEQADEVAALLRAGGFATVKRHRDLAGHERVLIGRS